MSARTFAPLVRSVAAISNFFTLAFGTRGGGHVGQVALTYGPAVAWPLSPSTMGIVTVTDGVAFAISAPTLDGTAFSAVAPFTSMAGLVIRLTIRNASGAAHGAGTFDAVFLTSAGVPAIANGFSRTFEFAWNGANFVEQWRTAADVAN